MAVPRGEELVERCEQLGIDTSVPCDMASRMTADDFTLQERLRDYERHRQEIRMMRVTVVSSLVSSIAALVAAVAALVR